MTLLRIIVLLAGCLAVLLVVVILRAETTRLHHQIARCEREGDQMRQQLLEAELELARLRNPTRIRQRVEEVVSHLADDQSAAGGARRTERR